MKVFLLDAIHERGIEVARKRAEVVLWNDPGIDAWLDEADGIILRGNTPITADHLAAARRLKAISKHGTGVDKIDVKAAESKGIVVMNTPALNADAVAEMAMALTFAVSRQVVYADYALRSGQDVRREDFDGSAGAGGGRSMEGKTLGVLGLGNIGRRVADKWRKAMGMTVLGYDPYLSADACKDLGVELVDNLDSLLPRVDLLSIHVPFSAETRHLIGAAELARMKPTSVLVNLARGGIVDEDALYDALKSKQIFGAALDVFEHEPPVRHRLFELANFVGTPHIGAGTIDSRELTAIAVAEQLLDVLEGAPPRNRVCA